jgi:Site-specific recombinases, DNA invertase Pin homologs
MGIFMSGKNEVITIAVYARKSKYTGKGESIENQIEKCRKYIMDSMERERDDGRLDAGTVIQFAEYRDEGVSGKNMERPMMKKLLADMEDGKIQKLVCYRLDRVSRNVKDFAELFERLTSLGVEFVSVNESFDTANPMGRAMISMSSVFAQLERETIAERIVDNMMGLAKTGRWLGGKPPLGFVSRKVEYCDENGKKRSHFRLELVPEEAEIAELIFSMYLKLGSLTKLETYLLNKDILSRNGKPYGRYVLRAILGNPVYCTADSRIYGYLSKNSYGIYAEETHFDGKHGLIAYNKNNNRTRVQRVNPVKDWIVSVGEHGGLVSSERWIQVQECLKKNAGMSYRYPKRIGALLSGMLRCGGCGSYMRPKGGRTAKDGQIHYYYQCECKERSRGQKCQMPNLFGNAADEMVVDKILALKGQYVDGYSYLKGVLHKLERTSCRKTEQDILKRQMEANEEQAKSLLYALGRSRNESTSSLILGRLDEINRQQEKLKVQCEAGKENDVMDAGGFNSELLSEDLLSMNKAAWNLLPPSVQKDILGKVVREIVWDGQYATIYLTAGEGCRRLRETW